MPAEIVGCKIEGQSHPADFGQNACIPMLESIKSLSPILIYLTQTDIRKTIKQIALFLNPGRCWILYLMVNYIYIEGDID